MPRRALFLPPLLLTGSLAGCARAQVDHAGGSMGHSSGASVPPSGRVVEVEMRDVSFSPDRLTVARGETVTFRFHNTGSQVHEAVIGDEAAQMTEEEAMAHAGGGGMGMHGGVEVAPGATGQLTYTFDKTGELLIGCHEPGHYAAGMKATLSVSG